MTAPPGFPSWLAGFLDDAGLDGETLADYCASVLDDADPEEAESVNEAASILQAIFDGEGADVDVDFVMNIWSGREPLPVLRLPVEEAPTVVAGPPHGDRPSSDDAAEDRIDTAECPVGHVDLSAGLRVEAAAFVPFTSTAAAGADVGVSEVVDPHAAPGDPDEVNDGLDIGSDIDMLAAVFPDLSSDTFEAALDASGGDVRVALDALFLCDAERAQGLPFASMDPSDPQNVVCRHFLDGGCYRFDCHFRHDVAGAVCHFWFRGQCGYGEGCEFRHGPSNTDIEDAVEKVLADTASQAAAEADEDSLLWEGARLATEQLLGGDTVVPAAAVDRDRALTMADRIKLRKLEELFPNAPASSVEQAFRDAAFQIDDAAAGLDVHYYRTQSTAPRPALPPASGVARRLAPGSAGQRGASGNHSAGETQPWLETGYAVASMYESHREEAIEHAVARNKFFHAATEAYLSGDKASARKWSRQGRYHDDRMRELHAEAADAIFAERNPSSAAMDGVIDLHGLHVSEALAFLENRLLSEARDGAASLTVVIGTGHHAVRGERVPPAVRAYLDEQGYRYSDVSPDRMGGMLRVLL